LDTNSRDGYFTLIYETTIPTVENAAEAAAWISESKFEQERQGDFEESAPHRAQAAHSCLIRAQRRMSAEPQGRLRFGRGARIKQGRDFVRVRQKGERLAFGCLIANWLRLPVGAVSRCGVITSGKLGNAVVRNRARRLLREAFRLHQHELALPVDLVLVARNSITNKGYAEVEKDFLTTLRKAGLLKVTD